MSTPNLPGAASLGDFLQSALATQSAPAAAEELATIKFPFPTVADRRGDAMLAVLDSKAACEKDRPTIRKVRPPAGDGTAATLTRIEGLASGRCAVRIFRDLSGDGVLRTNMLGRVSEPCAFLSNAAATAGPAERRAAAILAAAPLARRRSA